MSDTKSLTKLGSQKTKYLTDKPKPKLLEIFKSQHGNFHVVPFQCFEFSSLCPKTGQPDFATIIINYVPDKLCVESKSLKLYLFSFRNSGEFMEDITNRIMKDIIRLLKPNYIEVFAKFNSRGGIILTPYCNHYKSTKSREKIDRLVNSYYLASSFKINP